MANYLLVLNQVFHALANPTRRAVIRRLSAGSASVTELSAPFDMALPSFMKHLAVLEDCGLIKTRKEGRVRTCEIVPHKLEAADSWLAEQRVLWESRSDRLAAFAESLAKEHPHDEQS